MKLQHNGRRDGNVRVLPVNGVQHIAISGNLLFWAVLRFCLLRHKRQNPFRRRRHSLDTVGGFRALNDGNVAKRLQHLRHLLTVKSLASFKFTQQPDAAEDVLTDRLPFDAAFVEGFHVFWSRGRCSSATPRACKWLLRLSRMLRSSLPAGASSIRAWSGCANNRLLRSARVEVLVDFDDVAGLPQVQCHAQPD